MAHITDKKTIFFVTSPRSPHKLVDEIKFLSENFEGQKWNSETQKKFYLQLAKQDFFEGSATGDVAFKARDRVNRAPKSLGLIDLKPVIKLTEAGKKYVYGNRPEEIFLRQLLKFQLHSPYHKDKNNTFRIKPYLELMRLIYELDGLSKHEIGLFVIQLTDFAKYNNVKNKIINFREEKKLLRTKKINYKKFIALQFEKELTELFKEDIEQGKLSIRESKEQTLDNFVKTKRSNHLDYADASIRYLRATGLFSLNPKTSKVYILKERKNDIEFILKNIDRDIFAYKDEEDYEANLFDASKPLLLVDNKDLIISKITQKDTRVSVSALKEKDTEDLKNIYESLIKESLEKYIENEKSKLRNYEEYNDILEVFSGIVNRENIDPSLFFEWNIWRAFTMLNDGDIQGNFKIDDDGMPLYTAPGNTPDIVCKYKDFDAIVEVTLSSGQKQYEMEGEPVARHYGQYKKSNSKPVFGIFVAPNLNNATIAHYYGLYRINIEYYGGKSQIIPLSLEDFKCLLKNAHSSAIKPKADDLKNLFNSLSNLALKTENEKDWYQQISQTVQNAFVK
ncbi:MAG TPA: AlwI family type II restriction endonuclease [Candidatus Moranbacteria bacterium]|nr:AlwI family type II restriction endonuclease [Candidatus Moranbacteria bacterium]HRZ33467.1 AlwI family type II restriction endonuclease [Candidatus Moranbacteria bacterium]